jgi:hypothetical protein
MFKNRFLLVLGLLSLLLVAMAVSRPLAKTPTSVDLSLPHRPVIASRGYYFAIQRGREADSARLTAMAEYYQNIEEANPIQRGRSADALRWTAIAKHYS